MQKPGFPQRSKKVLSRAFTLVIIFCIIATSLLTLQIHSRSTDNPDFEITAAINPNTANAASLTRLPSIGPSRAASIINYRKKINQINNKKAFNNPNDLEIIKGIGPKTVEKIREYLVFE